MRQRIQCVTSVALSSSKKFSGDRFCAFILELPKLRRLSISRGNNKILNFKSVGDMVKKLPSSLRELRLVFSDSSSMLVDEYVNDLSTLYENDSLIASECAWSMTSAFPQLCSLEMTLSRSPNISWLPLSLTTLVLHMRQNAFVGPFYPILPRQLLSLQLHGEGFESLHRIQDLPPNLTSFEAPIVIVGYRYEVVDLPSTLMSFKIRDYPIRSRDDLMKLPPTLTKISPIFAQEFDCYDEIGSVMPHLTSLNLRQITVRQSTPSMIRSLPSSITKLSLRNDMEPFQPSDWPSSLLKLKMLYPCKNFRVDALPSNLTALSIEVNTVLTASDISKLPRSLLVLQCFFDHHLEKCEFPPKLTALALKDRSRHFAFPWVVMEREFIEYEYTEYEKENRPMNEAFLCNNGTTVRLPFNPSQWDVNRFLEGEKVAKCFDLALLPRTITDLKTTAVIPASQLKHLPPRLKVFKANCIFRDADFRPDDPIEINAMHSIMRIGEGEGVKEKFDWQQLVSTSISSLLPRTLQDLIFSRFCHLGRSEGLYLPPNLTTLQIYSLDPQRVDGDLLLDLFKLEHLSSLDVTIKTFTDEHCKAFPRDLTALIGGPLDISQLTERGALYIPLSSSVSLTRGYATHFGIFRERLEDKIRHAINDEDDTLYRKLLNSRDNVEFCYDLLAAKK